MRQFVLPRHYAGETHFTLDGADFHYLMRVLRKRQGDRMPAMTPGGAPLLVSIERVDKASCLVRLEQEQTPPEGMGPRPRIKLLQCLPKGRKMDLIVRQAVEAGVECIVPALSERCVAVPQDASARMQRWLRIAKEALQQSGSIRPPTVERPLPLAEAAVLGGECEVGLFFHEQYLPGASLHRALAGFRPDGVVTLVVGPEGGLSPAEVELLGRAGFRRVYLGDSVLRTETAALFALAAVKTVLRESDQWMLSHPK